MAVVYYEAVITTMNPDDLKAISPAGGDSMLPGSVVLFISTLDKELLQKPMECLKCAIPSLCYTVQNNLLYFALSHLDAVTFQVGYQTKILTTAVFSVVILNKRLSLTQWASLVILMVGVSMAQLSSAKGSGDSSGNSSTLGFLAVFSAAISSGFSGVYLETILKGVQTTLWIRNIQLSVFSIVLGLVTVYFSTEDYQSVVDNGFFYGYTSVVWTTILLQAAGGLLVAVVVKYADNIIKGFAASFSMITSCIISIFLFDFKPSFMFLGGAVLVNTAMYLYGKYPYIQTEAELVSCEAQAKAKVIQMTVKPIAAEEESLLKNEP